MAAMDHTIQEDVARPLLSVVVPVYGNEGNIPSLVDALNDLSGRVGGVMQVVFVVDASPDRSGELLLAARDRFRFAAKIAFHSRNFGAFTAIRTGLEIADGHYLAAMAADLQEPPELLLEFLAALRANEADIVFGVRRSRNDGPVRDALSGAFWWFYRRLINRDMPQGGVDIFGCNRSVRDVLLTIEEPNSSLIAQMFWIGFRRKFVPYDRRERTIGKSAWNFSRRFAYMMDSVLSFSDLPIVLVLWLGVLGCIVSALFAVVVIVGRLTGAITEPGYPTLVLLISFFGSFGLVVQGVIGLYIWRTFENTKHRPLRIISRVVVQDEAQAHPADGSRSRAG